MQIVFNNIFNKSRLAWTLSFGIGLMTLAFSIPLGRAFLPDPGYLFFFPMQSVSLWVAGTLGLDPVLVHFNSDTVLLYVAGAIALLLSLLIFIWLMARLQHVSSIWLIGIRVVLRYYLAWQLLYYGWNKVFKWQFYLPEPNLLYRTFGSLDPDILYWSVMGLSRPYSVFLGLLEVLGAFLVFFRRSYPAGALLATGIMLQVVAINFCFDISVKFFSSFLLLISLYLIAPYGARMWNLGRQITLPLPSYLRSPRSRASWKPGVQTLVICLLLVDSLSPYWQSGNYNDDRADRPFWHGAYVLESNSRQWHRFYVHRGGYLILEQEDQTQKDYPAVNWEEGHFAGSGFDFHLIGAPADSVRLRMIDGLDTLEIRATPLSWRDLPALQPLFHWTVDELQVDD